MERRRASERLRDVNNPEIYAPPAALSAKRYLLDWNALQIAMARWEWRSDTLTIQY
ncbi:MAG: hypothetical protein J7J76_09295 [Candidatus Latescibacteria bacterium]|nr:hypothetical protein [Candidatus Latescibacterota bacterium]